jgi:hypothetical protein
MSVMRDDEAIRHQPRDAQDTSHVTHLADLAGRGVAYEQDDVDPRHGTIVSANYSLGGETVLVVHPDSRPSELLANTVSWAVRPTGPSRTSTLSETRPLSS